MNGAKWPEPIGLTLLPRLNVVGHQHFHKAGYNLRVRRAAARLTSPKCSDC